MSPLKIASYAGLAVGAIVLVCLLAFLLFTDPIVNGLIKPRITKALAESFPADSIRIGDMHYNVWKNHLSCDSMVLQTSEITCSVASLSVGGIGWKNILWEREFSPDILTNIELDAQSIVLNLHQAQTVVCFGTMHISVPDSEMMADSIQYYSLLDDEQFFANSQFKQTRFRFDVPQLRVIGLDYPELFHGTIYRAKSITMSDMFADILVNMDKPNDKSSSNPQMPNDAIVSMKETVKLDSLKIINGRVKYCERYVPKALPAVITFDKIDLSVGGIANHTDLPETAGVSCEALLMNSGKLKIRMEIPLTGKDLSLRYSGSLGTMDLTELNAFLEPGEHRRIKSGVVESAMFDIGVSSGDATGTLRLAYKDLSVSVLNKETGSENGILNRLSTLIGKVFVIRGTNMPGEEGLPKIGNVKYTRNPKETFIQFLWFTLRASIADVVGFPPIASE